MRAFVISILALVAFACAACYSTDEINSAEEAMRDNIELQNKMREQDVALKDIQRRCDALFAGLRIGMHESRVRNDQPSPPGSGLGKSTRCASINTIETASVLHEQWVWGDDRYTYFDNGILTAIQR